MKNSKDYTIKFDISSDDKKILIMLRSIGKYLYNNCNKLLKMQAKSETWSWKSCKKTWKQNKRSHK